jgi:tripartite-type tricarboxylate transporter receptor subunit TctC
MTADNSVNLVIETPQNYLNFKQRNPRLQALGITCATRNPKLPNVKTLAEQGFRVPTIWTYIVANTKMPVEKRENLSRILDQAMLDIGQQQIFDMIDFSVPVFRKTSTEQHFKSSIRQSTHFKEKFINKLDK